MKTIILFFFMIPFYVNAQELRMTGQLGNAIGKFENTKKIMLNKSYTMGYEKWIGYNLYMNFELGYSFIQYDDIALDLNTKYFRTKHYITLPLSLKKYYTLSRTSTYYIEVGLANNYNLKDKIEYADSNIGDSIKKNLGYSLGLLVRFGFKTRFGKNHFVDFGLGTNDDLLIRYKDESQKFRAKKYFFLMSLYRKLSK